MMNFPLLDYVNDHAETVFLSTGLSNLEEINEVLSHLNQVRECYVLHCCTQYPTKDEQANLQVIPLLRLALPGHPIGYSDHTLGPEASVAAVALGATVVEKHFTLDKDFPGTDHVISVTPPELQEMVERIRRVEVLLGSPVKAPIPEDLEIRDFVRNRWAKG
jgi:sialic acid synthase SpsE